ncbi:MAG: putative CXXCH cytochrome family protein [Planctomycetota bacterium]|jgi:predicted CXXCH cytochrome family protein
MARSMGPLDPMEFVGFPPVSDGGSGFQYAFENDEQRAYLVERHQGDSTFVRRHPLLFALGAGVLDRSYAVQVGRYQWFAPLEILSLQAGRKAAMAPQHMMHARQRFDAPITSECLGCHTDNPPPANYPLNIDATSKGWSPHGISCAACHAGKAGHIDWQERDLDGHVGSGNDPVISLGSLSRNQRMSLCAACHLQGDARIAHEPGALGPPLAGTDLMNTRAVFVAAKVTDELGFVSQTERLVESACYRVDQSMICSTCHDPHRSLQEPGERKRMRDACNRCHAHTLATAATNAAHASVCSNTTQAVLDLSLERYPIAEGALRNRSIVKDALGQHSAAAKDLHQAFLQLPSSALANSLQSYCQRQGDAAGGQAWSRMAAMIEPQEQAIE